MEVTMEILKYTLPALIVFFTAFLILRAMIKNDEQKRNVETSLARQKTILPLRLQAYERITMFLERISPESLIIRANQPNMTARQLQNELISTIRAEFDHNLSQQVYISHEAWEMVKKARAGIIQLINTASEQIKPDASSITMSKKILELVMELNVSPIGSALIFIKKEVQELY
ncbi:MAG: hypothetical protein ISS19_10230 [Bacteroidales bacterium]|nr:hypothetical protein [Bacteroidales bacterium]